MSEQRSVACLGGEDIQQGLRLWAVRSGERVEVYEHQDEPGDVGRRAVFASGNISHAVGHGIEVVPVVVGGIQSRSQLSVHVARKILGSGIERRYVIAVSVQPCGGLF